MTANDLTKQPCFSVRVTFTCEGEAFGHEEYRIHAADEEEAEREALKRSESSPYDDPRIPDRLREVSVELDPLDPDFG